MGTQPAQRLADVQLAMDAAMANPDPVIKARWKSIPHQGEMITLEEFVEFAAALSY